MHELLIALLLFAQVIQSLSIGPEQLKQTELHYKHC